MVRDNCIVLNTELISQKRELTAMASGATVCLNQASRLVTEIEEGKKEILQVKSELIAVQSGATGALKTLRDLEKWITKEIKRDEKVAKDRNLSASYRQMMKKQAENRGFPGLIKDLENVLKMIKKVIADKSPKDEQWIFSPPTPLDLLEVEETQDSESEEPGDQDPSGQPETNPNAIENENPTPQQAAGQEVYENPPMPPMTPIAPERVPQPSEMSLRQLAAQKAGEETPILTKSSHQHQAPNTNGYQHPARTFENNGEITPHQPESGHRSNPPMTDQVFNQMLSTIKRLSEQVSKIDRDNQETKNEMQSVRKEVRRRFEGGEENGYQSGSDRTQSLNSNKPTPTEIPQVQTFGRKQYADPNITGSRHLTSTNSTTKHDRRERLGPIKEETVEFYENEMKPQTIQNRYRTVMDAHGRTLFVPESARAKSVNFHNTDTAYEYDSETDDEEDYKQARTKRYPTRKTKKNSRAQSPDRDEEQSEHRRSTRRTRVHLKPMELHKFTGKESYKFEEWFLMYKKLYLDNSDLDDLDRFYYLKEHVTGDASNLLESIELKGSNLQAAIDTLKHNYVTDDRPLERLHQTFATAKIAQKDHNQMLTDVIKVAGLVFQIERHGGSTSEPTIYRNFLSKLPLSIRREVLRKVEDRTFDGKFLKVYQWTQDAIRMEIKISEDLDRNGGSNTKIGDFDVRDVDVNMVQSGRARDPKNQTFFRSSGRQPEANGAYPKSSQQNGNCCFHAENESANHSRYRCYKTPTACYQMAKTKGLCFLCLRTGHGYNHCPEKNNEDFACRVSGCGALHSTVFHNIYTSRATRRYEQNQFEQPKQWSNTGRENARNQNYTINGRGPNHYNPQNSNESGRPQKWITSPSGQQGPSYQ